MDGVGRWSYWVYLEKDLEKLAIISGKERMRKHIIRGIFVWMEALKVKTEDMRYKR